MLIEKDKLIENYLKKEKDLDWGLNSLEKLKDERASLIRENLDLKRKVVLLENLCEGKLE